MKNNYNSRGICRKLYLFVLFSMFSFLVLTSCSQDNLNEDASPAPVESGNLKTLGDLTLQKNVIILDDESVAAISTVNNQSITFTRATDQTDEIKKGTVLVGTKV